MEFFFLIPVRDDSYKVFQPSICLISDVIELLLGTFREFCRRNQFFSRENESKRKKADFSEDESDPEMAEGLELLG